MKDPMEFFVKTGPLEIQEINRLLDVLVFIRKHRFTILTEIYNEDCDEEPTEEI